MIWGDIKERKEINKRQYHWGYQLLFIPKKPDSRWFYIGVMRIMTKTCTIRAVAIYTSIQVSICQFMMLHKKTRSQTLEFILKQRWVNTFHLRKGWNWKGIFLLPYQLLRKYHWILIKYFILKIIDKPGHGHMRYTQCQIHSPGEQG